MWLVIASVLACFDISKPKGPDGNFLEINNNFDNSGFISWVPFFTKRVPPRWLFYRLWSQKEKFECDFHIRSMAARNLVSVESFSTWLLSARTIVNNGGAIIWLNIEWTIQVCDHWQLTDNSISKRLLVYTVVSWLSSMSNNKLLVKIMVDPWVETGKCPAFSQLAPLNEMLKGFLREKEKGTGWDRVED